MRIIPVTTIGVVALSAFCLLAPAHGAKRAPQFSGVTKCRTCHEKQDIGDQYGSWRASPHARAFETLGSEAAKKIAAQRGLGPDPRQIDACLACHTAAHDEPKDRVARSYKDEEGVSCEACHGPGSIYRSKQIMLDHTKSVANGLIEPGAETCARCHNPRSPSWDPSRYTLADGSKAGFDFGQARAKIAHPVPAGYTPPTGADDAGPSDD